MMDNYQLICATFLIQDALMIALRDEATLEFERPSDVWAVYSNSLRHSNVLENFETAVEHSYKFAPDECRSMCDRIWYIITSAPIEERHRVVYETVMNISDAINITEAVNTNLFKFMALLAEMCSCFWLREEYFLISTAVDTAAICFCHLMPGNALGMINIIDKAAYEYLRHFF